MPLAFRRIDFSSTYLWKGSCRAKFVSMDGEEGGEGETY